MVAGPLFNGIVYACVYVSLSLSISNTLILYIIYRASRPFLNIYMCTCAYVYDYVYRCVCATGSGLGSTRAAAVSCVATDCVVPKVGMLLPAKYSLHTIHLTITTCV